MCIQRPYDLVSSTLFRDVFPCFLFLLYFLSSSLPRCSPLSLARAMEIFPSRAFHLPSSSLSTTLSFPHAHVHVRGGGSFSLILPLFLSLPLHLSPLAPLREHLCVHEEEDILSSPPLPFLSHARQNSLMFPTSFIATLPALACLSGEI